MAETEDIARIAEKVSKEIFQVFGWERVTATNQNWECVTERHVIRGASGGPEAEAGGSRQKRSHPSDVVYRYQDPYRDGPAYITTDLKSFAESTITTEKIGKALHSLCQSAECANISPEWRELYAQSSDHWRAYGMLFVYNHDDDYNPERFAALIKRISASQRAVTQKNRVFIVGPGDIAYLISVATDMRLWYADHANQGTFEWFYPDLVMRRTRSLFSNAATIEALLAPWQLVALSKRGELGAQRHGFRMFYRGPGTTVEEFEYIFEFLFRYRLLDDCKIDIRLPNGDPKATANFAQARDRVVEDLYGLPEFRERLNRVSCDHITTVLKRFSPTQIGMEDR